MIGGPPGVVGHFVQRGTVLVQKHDGHRVKLLLKTVEMPGELRFTLPGLALVVDDPPDRVERVLCIGICAAGPRLPSENAFP